MKSIVSYPDRGSFGNNKYRGNCSGKLIEDIIDQYRIGGLSDFMVGGGTTEAVVKARDLRGDFADLNRGFDMMCMDIPSRAENIFWHPPYGTMIQYSDSMYRATDVEARYGLSAETVRADDLSRCASWDEFIKKLNHCMLKQFAALEKGGRMFTLVGDMKKSGRLYSMICDMCKPGQLEQVIIKAQHNCWSDTQSYSNNNFVPIVHEYLLVTRKDPGMSLVVPVSLAQNYRMDLRKSSHVSWRDAIYAILEDRGGEMTLEELYDQMKDSPKTSANRFWQEKIRQTVQNGKYFRRTARGCYALAA